MKIEVYREQSVFRTFDNKLWPIEDIIEREEVDGKVTWLVTYGLLDGHPRATGRFETEENAFEYLEFRKEKEEKRKGLDTSLKV
ncbi:MAG: hypothetical protein NTX88_10910 [Candidatus Atribacteria bacterium]|nr:hypothetical protein [Candidatus Atribacteria bacterium]